MVIYMKDIRIHIWWSGSWNPPRAPRKIRHSPALLYTPMWCLCHMVIYMKDILINIWWIWRATADRWVVRLGPECGPWDGAATRVLAYPPLQVQPRSRGSSVDERATAHATRVLAYPPSHRLGPNVPRVKQQSLCNPRGAAARSISISVKRRRPWRGHSPKLGTSKKHCVQFKSSPDPPPDKGRSPFNPAGNVPFANPSNPPAPRREAERTNPPPLSWHPLADRGPGQGPLSPPTSGGIAGPSPAPLAAGPWGEVRR